MPPTFKKKVLQKAEKNKPSLQTEKLAGLLVFYKGVCWGVLVAFQDLCSTSKKKGQREFQNH